MSCSPETMISRFNRTGRPSRVSIELRAERCPFRGLGRGGVVLVVDEPELQRRRRAEHAQRLVRVLHARQLHHDAVHALPGDDRLRDAEFVDAIAQRRDVLLDREVLALLDLVRAQRDGQAGAFRTGVRVERQVRVLLAQGGSGPVEVGRVAQHDPDRVVRGVAGDAGEWDAFVAQQQPVVAFHARQQLLDGTLHVHFVEEIHAAAQVEAETHRFQPERTHPGGRARDLRQRHEVLARRGLLQDVARLQLRRGGVETQHEPITIEVGGIDGRAFRLQQCDHLVATGRRGSGAVVARQLQGGRLAEYVRQCEHQRDEQDDGDQPEFSRPGTCA